MPVARNETQKTINFGELYPRLEKERARLGIGNFAEFIRHIAVRYLEGKGMGVTDRPGEAEETL